jgi:PrtD family type I secretion system ABC transporter
MREFLNRCRFIFIYLWVFSLCINVLMLAMPLYMMQLFDRVFGSRSPETLILLTLIVLVAIGVSGVLDMLRSRLLLRSGTAIDQILSPLVLAELVRATARQDGEAHAFALRDVGTVRGFLSSRAITAFFDAPWSPLFVVLIYFFHPVLGIMATVGIAVMFGLAFLEEKTTREALEEAKLRMRRTGTFAERAVRNSEVVYGLGMTPAISARWLELNRDANVPQTAASNRANEILAASKFVRTGLQILMLAVGAYLIIDQHLTPGIMIGAGLILGRALAPIEMVISAWRNSVEARAAYRRLDAMMKEVEARERPIPLPEPAGKLSVERVVFTRTSIVNPILKGVSFELAAGESLGLIGPSAAGKSTLARVVMGIWRPLSGAVRLDGANIADLDREALAQHIGYLPQDVELFAGTVAENIARMGDPVANAEGIVAAAKAAGVHDLILRLPEAYDTAIGPDGARLSGGQRQRIGLARAMFGRPRLVVLDEPNSNLDAEGEDALMQAMQRLKEDGCTLIVITHRPSILANIDKMVVLRDGRVEISGTRQEVMAKMRSGGTPPAGAVRPVSQPRPIANT